MLLKSIKLLRDRVPDWQAYPFNVPVIQRLDELTFRKPITFFVGENGSGKSTLLEAIAAHYGFGREGGNRNYTFRSTDSVEAIEPLVKALRLGFKNRTGKGFYLRAESFFNVATYVDEVDATPGFGYRSLHDQSHGESFLTLLEHKFSRPGFYLMDEPEAALSPQRQLTLLVMLHQVLKEEKEVQFVIATHSPILLAFPGAQILSFDGEEIREISYRESAPYQLVSRFLAAPERYLAKLFADNQPELPI